MVKAIDFKLTETEKLEILGGLYAQTIEDFSSDDLENGEAEKLFSKIEAFQNGNFTSELLDSEYQSFNPLKEIRTHNTL
ncbi:hypothetical protein [Halobacteriovorax sp. ZH2_bin.1]|uniref:hypothetical protein n=1 Tax=unclassified Halobacteriovorax TaxID=2639665 RepID=UPI00371B635A